MKLTDDIRAIDKQIAANDNLVARAQEETAELQAKRKRIFDILTDDEKAELAPAPSVEPEPPGE